MMSCASSCPATCAAAPGMGTYRRAVRKTMYKRLGKPVPEN